MYLILDSSICVVASDGLTFNLYNRVVLPALSYIDHKHSISLDDRQCPGLLAAYKTEDQYSDFFLCPEKT